VLAAAVRISTSETEFGSRLTASELAVLPLPSEARNLVAFTPGARPDQIWGAATGQANNYQLDGVAVNHPGLGGDFLQPSTSWIEEIEVRGLGKVYQRGSEELHVLQAGAPNLGGNAALLAAGTGMGQSFLFNDGRHLVPAPSEGGHADFAARTPREWQLVQWLAARYGRAEVEMVVSGIGLNNLYHFAHGDDPCVALDAATPPDLPKVASEKARARACPHCIEVMEIFADAYGAEAGNLALRTVATRGVYIGGGIAPKNVELFDRPSFLERFLQKGTMSDLLHTIPLKVILNPQAGLLGAATVANQM